MEKKLLDLNAYGVEEMSSTEMREIDGGWKLLGKILFKIVRDEILNPGSFRAGYESVRNN